MRSSNSKETIEIVGQAHRLPVRGGRQAERLPYNQKEEMALGLGWWSVQQSFVERGPASAQGYGSARAGLQSKPAEKGEALKLWQR
jgi:hypothetical protein